MNKIIYHLLTASAKASSDEYFKAVSQHYDADVVAKIKQGEQLAVQMTNGKVQTEKSDNGTLLVRWVKGKDFGCILGVVSTTGKLRKSDLKDFNKWVKRLIQKMKEDYTVLTSPNKLSMPLLNHVLKRGKKFGLDVTVSNQGSVEYKGMTWENLVITKN